MDLPPVYIKGNRWSTNIGLVLLEGSLDYPNQDPNKILLDKYPHIFSEEPYGEVYDTRSLSWFADVDHHKRFYKQASIHRFFEDEAAIYAEQGKRLFVHLRYDHDRAVIHYGWSYSNQEIEHRRYFAHDSFDLDKEIAQLKTDLLKNEA
jgi:hypothetical protein